MLALITGSGALPAAVAKAQDTPPLVWALEGFLPDNLTPDAVFRIEHLGSVLSDLRDRGVTRVCLCGHIQRPDIDAAQVDAATAPMVPRLQEALTLGDDGALRIVITLFEEAGFEVIGVDEAARKLLPRPGVLSEMRAGQLTDYAAQCGDRALAEMAAADLGQACIVLPDGSVIKETEAGTDALLDSHQGMGWLYKAAKPGQDRRADLPTIGPDTVRRAARAGLLGIIIEHGSVLVLDIDEVFDLISEHAMLFWVRRRPD